MRTLDASAASTDPTVAPTTTPSNTAVPATNPATPTTTLPAPEDTGDGIGDELYPDLGNPGVDVLDYEVELATSSAGDVVAGSATLTIAFTQERDQFTLDSLGPEIDTVSIDGNEVAFESDEPELRITPSETIAAGETHVVTVDYTVVVTDIGSNNRFAPG